MFGIDLAKRLNKIVGRGILSLTAADDPVTAELKIHANIVSVASSSGRFQIAFSLSM